MASAAGPRAGNADCALRPASMLCKSGSLVIFAYSWDIDLHVGNEPCQTVGPVVVDMARKEVTTGLNFWFRGKPQSLALLLNTTAGRRQKREQQGSRTQELQKMRVILLVDVGCDCNE